MKPEDTANFVLYALILALVIFGALSFFVGPVYEKGAWAVITCLISGISAVLGFKFGVHIPQQGDKQ